MQKWLLSLLLVGVTLFVGCGGSSGSGPTPPPTTPTLTAITVTPGQSCIALGTTQPTQQFAATGTYSDGSTKVSPQRPTGFPALRRFDRQYHGPCNGMTAGTTISATSGTITGSTVLTVMRWCRLRYRLRQQQLRRVDPTIHRDGHLWRWQQQNHFSHLERLRRTISQMD